MSPSPLGNLWAGLSGGRGWRQLDDRALCRRLTLQGFEHVHAARAAASSVLWFTGTFGEPALAERVLRLYGDDPEARLAVLPEDPGEDESVEVFLLGDSRRCSLRLARAALGQGAALLPIFGGLGEGSAFRVEIGEALLPLDRDAADLTRRALAIVDARARRFFARD